MLEINPNFRKYYNRNREEVRYKMRRPLFVVDYNQLDDAGSGGQPESDLYSSDKSKKMCHTCGQ